MKAESFIYSWPALWLWMQHLATLLAQGRVVKAYTFQKGRLDLEIDTPENSYRLAWQKQGNKALLTYTDRFSTPKKRVDVLGSLVASNSTLSNIQINQSDRVLKLIFGDGMEIIIGAFPAVLNIYVVKEGKLTESFLKTDGLPELHPDWIDQESQLPVVIPAGDALDFDLADAQHGLQLDTDSLQVRLSESGTEKMNIADLTIQVLRSKGNKPKKEAVSVQKIAGNVQKRWKRKLKKVQADLDEASSWPELEIQMQGFQIAQAYQLNPVEGVLKIKEDHSPTGEAMTLNMSADTTVTEMIPQLAKRIRKQKEKMTQLPPLIQAIEADMSKLAELMEEDDALKAFLMEKGEALDRDGSPRTERKPYKKYASPNGYDILVGRGSTDNDTLTFKVAGKNDWWFHARGVRGSHVILRCGKTEPEQQDILKAAKLAARNSKAQHSGIVVVQYCQRKHVTKPKGSSPGTVLVHQEQTITIDLDDSN